MERILLVSPLSVRTVSGSTLTLRFERQSPPTLRMTGSSTTTNRLELASGFAAEART